MSRRIYESKKIVVTRESKLLQNKRRSSEENTDQQLQLLQKNVSTPEERHIEVRRSSNVQHFRFNLHNKKVCVSNDMYIRSSRGR